MVTHCAQYSTVPVYFKLFRLLFVSMTNQVAEEPGKWREGSTPNPK
jgi:hypothetical protein